MLGILYDGAHRSDRRTELAELIGKERNHSTRGKLGLIIIAA